MAETLEEIVELSLYYDYYGELLGESKRRIFENYVQNDYSLSEIADTEGISRQGVHDVVKRCIKQLKEYEAVLHLVENAKKQNKRLNELESIIGGPDKNTDRALELIDEIRAEI